MRQFPSSICTLLVVVLFVQLSYHVETIKSDDSSESFDSSTSTAQPAMPENSTSSTAAPARPTEGPAPDDGSHHEQGSTDHPEGPTDGSRSGIDSMRDTVSGGDVKKFCSEHTALLEKCCKVSIDDILGGKTSQQCLKESRLLGICCECCASPRKRQALMHARQRTIQLLSRCIIELMFNILNSKPQVPEICCRAPFINLLPQCRKKPTKTTKNPTILETTTSTKKPKTTTSTKKPKTSRKPNTTMKTTTTTEEPEKPEEPEEPDDMDKPKSYKDDNDDNDDTDDDDMPPGGRKKLHH